MQLSIVTTMYRSAAYLPDFYRRASHEAQKFVHDEGQYEIVFVNDGSPDDSLDVALTVQQTDPCVVIVDLSRNFGHHKAMMTGLSHAQGDFVFLIDCDLEEDPELLSTFYEALQNNPRADVAYGVQVSRKGGWFERVSGRIFYQTINTLWEFKLPEDLIVARLMTQRYVKNLIQFGESELVISGLWLATGFFQIPIKVHKHSRSGTNYVFWKKIALLIRSVTAFSNKPLIYIAVLGAIILLASFVYLLFILWTFLHFGTVPEGYTSIIASVWFLGGLIIFSIGVVAIYLSVIFVETKKRPNTIIRHIYKSDDFNRHPDGKE